MKKLKECRNDYLAEIETILEKAQEEDRVLTAEEVARLQELKELVEDMNKQIAVAEESRALTIVEENKEEKGDKDNMENRALEVREMEINAFAEAVKNADTRGLTTGTNGGVIPTAVADMIVTAIKEKSPVLEMAKIYNEVGQLKIVKAEKVVADYIDENTDLSEGNMAMTTITLNNFTIGSLIVVSKSLINMSNIDIVKYVVEQIADALSVKIERELLVGTDSKIVGCAGTTNTVVLPNAYELADLMKTQAKAIGTKAEECAWIMSREMFEDMVGRTDKIGRPFMVTGMTAEGKVSNLLLGARVFVSDQMENKSLFYGDFKGLAVKISQAVEVQTLTERFATKNAIGVVGFVGLDAKVERDEFIVKATVSPSRSK
ncbi:phage major capsid protein [Romboutsia ilealis]|uniref:phage major capsid protein n=1 Tax=Romboutsia ilealis TaxID=1115758 RepID=UPI002493EA2E|nr:phage major capsid protein [Romboutsia ilealis]